MQKQTLGRTSLEVTRIAFGCWQAGGEQWTDVDDQESIKAIQTAFFEGINFFDTAENYGDGYSERILAYALDGHRDEIVIASKVGQAHLSADEVRAACERSLQNLNTDRIDLYQIHWPAGSWGSPLVPIEETMEALLDLQQDGKIVHIGVSNFNGQQLEEALACGRVESNQIPYSLFWRPFETNGTNQVCLDNQVSILAYSPLAQGLLTGKFTLDNRPTDNRAGSALFKSPTYELALRVVEQLKALGGAPTSGQALQWLLHQEGLTSAICGARNAPQIQGTIDSASLELTERMISIIDRVGKQVTDTLTEEQTNMWA